MYDKILEMAEASYRAGGDPEALLLHPRKLVDLKNEIQPSGVSITNPDGIIITRLHTPFGHLRIYTDKFCPRETIYVLSEADARRIMEESKRMIEEMFGKP
jgi:hypothetical protein